MFFSTKGPYVLYLDLIRSLAIVITIGFAIGQTPLAKDLFSLERSLKKQFLLGIFFGCVAILGTALGTPVKGAIANLRDVGAIGGGLFGGPLVGLIAGVIGGVERFYFGGFTADSSVRPLLKMGRVSLAIFRTFSAVRALIFSLSLNVTWITRRNKPTPIEFARIIGPPMILIRFTAFENGLDKAITSSICPVSAMLVKSIPGNTPKSSPLFHSYNKPAIKPFMIVARAQGTAKVLQRNLQIKRRKS